MKQQEQLGLLLKQWRAKRGKSQMALALDAGVSPRHVSFVESGRSAPSRDLLLALADALDIPLRERNVLLTAAGFAPMYSENALSSTQLVQAQSALNRLLAHQEPYPAVLLDRQWNVLQTNRSAPRFFSHFIDLNQSKDPPNLLRTMFNPEGMRPWVENWDVVSRTLVQRVFREAVGGVPDERTMALLHALDAPLHTQSTSLVPHDAPLPFIPIVFRKDHLRLSFFSMITSVGAPVDITAQELRIEALFPADDVTKLFARDTLGADY